MLYVSTRATSAATSIWLDHEGKAQGRFFNCTMSSAFQPIRQVDTSAVRATRAQADRILYKAAVREILENQPNLWIFHNKRNQNHKSRNCQKQI